MLSVGVSVCKMPIMKRGQLSRPRSPDRFGSQGAWPSPHSTGPRLNERAECRSAEMSLSGVTLTCTMVGAEQEIAQEQHASRIDEG